MNIETVYGLYDTSAGRRRKEKAKLSKNYVLPLELMSNWRNCSVVSDLVVSDDMILAEMTAAIRNVLSTITNELLENAIKFSYDKNKLVTLSLHNFPNNITIETTNISHEKNAKSLKSFIKKLQTKNLDDLYFEQLERSITNHDNASGLGFLGIMKDYDANLGIKIQNRRTSVKKRNNHTYDVFVQISLHKETLIQH